MIVVFPGSVRCENPGPRSPPEAGTLMPGRLKPPRVGATLRNAQMADTPADEAQPRGLYRAVGSLRARTAAGPTAIRTDRPAVSRQASAAPARTPLTRSTHPGPATSRRRFVQRSSTAAPTLTRAPASTLAKTHRDRSEPPVGSASASLWCIRWPRCPSPDAPRLAAARFSRSAAGDQRQPISLIGAARRDEFRPPGPARPAR